VARRNTRLESEGAEFLVLGNLLIQGIAAYKSYTNQSGYDIVAVSPDTNRSARIQVKSRLASDAGDFLIRRFDCDFVVLARLNRGQHFSRKKKELPTEPNFYVLTSKEAEEMASKKGWGKLKWDSTKLDFSKAAWDRIRKFLDANTLA
jgi:hypothetical protein